MNDLMSVGLHREWKDAFVERLGPFVHSRNQTSVLDVAGGTGDTAFRILESAKRSVSSPHASSRCDVTVCDINPDMLAEGEKRAERLGYLSPSKRFTLIQTQSYTGISLSLQVRLCCLLTIRLELY